MLTLKLVYHSIYDRYCRSLDLSYPIRLSNGEIDERSMTDMFILVHVFQVGVHFVTKLLGIRQISNLI